MAWRIIEIETATSGWRSTGPVGEDDTPVAFWALVEDDAGRRLVVGVDPSANGSGGPGGRLVDIDALVGRVVDTEGGYTYRAPLS